MNRPTLAAALVLSLVATSCGQGSDVESHERGASSLAFEVAPGVVVSTATYQITGPGDFNSAGTVPVGSSASVPVTLSGIPIAAGYSLTLFATASDGVTTCTGSTPFDVTSSSPITVVAVLECGVPEGTVNVVASINVCPVVDTLDVSPAEVRVGGKIALSATARDSDSGPNPLAYRWRAGGSLLASTQPSLLFTCTSVGAVTLSVSASDGDLACSQALTATLTCSPP